MQPLYLDEERMSDYELPPDEFDYKFQNLNISKVTV